MREKLERVKDAIGAATAAREEGIVPGGGISFIRMARVLDSKNEGSRLLQSVLFKPTEKLLENSGEDKATIDKYIHQIRSGKDINIGYEVNSGKLMDLMAEGVIDPAKVIRLALLNAVAVATSILTTDALIGLEVKEGKGE